jgi:hypothetical protein
MAETKGWEIYLSQCHFSNTNTETALVLNLGIYGEKPATYRMNYGTARCGL